MPFRPPPAGLNDSFSGTTWTPPIASAKGDDTKPSNLSNDDAEVVEQYRKMLKMGMPRGAVAQKMDLYGVSQLIQDIVLAIDESDQPPPGIESSADQVTVEKTLSSDEVTAVLNVDEEEMASKYRKMLKMGMPEGAVTQKMAVDEVPQHVQDAVLHLPVEDNGIEAPNVKDNRVELTPDEVEIVSKYRKMLKMGMPEGAVTQKMAVDEVPQHVQNEVLQDSLGAEDIQGTAMGTSVEDRREVNRDGAIETAPANEDGRQNEQAQPPQSNETTEDSTEFVAAAQQSQGFEKSEETSLEFVTDSDEEVTLEEEIIEEEEIIFDETNELHESSDDKGFSPVDGIEVTEEIEYPPESAVAVEATTITVQEEETVITTFHDQNSDRIVNDNPQSDEERGVRAFHNSEVTTKNENLRRDQTQRRNPDWIFHRLVFLAYFLLIGGAVAACLILLLDEDETSEAKPSGSPTTSLDPIDTGSCDFSTSTQPHVVDQCRCNDQIGIIAEDVRDRYQQHRQDFIPILYDSYEEAISSCTARNQALVWLSTANDFQFSDEIRSERFALATLFIATMGENWLEQSNWLSPSITCEWFGVACTTDGKIESIYLSSNNVHGTIPSEVVILQDLLVLSLSQNEISGEIPPEVFSLSNLMGLYLNQNNIDGQIPASIAEATALEELDFQTNGLSGSIPSGLGLATKLESLNLGDNKFVGGLPSFLFSLASLRDLQVQSNLLDGQIPNALSQLSNLRLLDVSSNFISGSIPSEVGKLSLLTSMRMNDNNLIGGIPSDLGNLTDLDSMILDGNILQGVVPTSICDLRGGKLEELVVDCAAIECAIPDCCSSCRD